MYVCLYRNGLEIRLPPTGLSLAARNRRINEEGGQVRYFKAQLRYLAQIGECVFVLPNLRALIYAIHGLRRSNARRSAPPPCGRRCGAGALHAAIVLRDCVWYYTMLQPGALAERRGGGCETLVHTGTYDAGGVWDLIGHAKCVPRFLAGADRDSSPGVIHSPCGRRDRGRREPKESLGAGQHAPVGVESRNAFLHTTAGAAPMRPAVTP